MQTINIYSQLEANKLPSTLEGNLNVLRSNVVLTALKSVSGYVYIRAEGAQLPALTEVSGSVYIRAESDYLNLHNEIEGVFYLYLRDDVCLKYNKLKYSFGEYTLDFFISVLKCRHSSFENFLTREVNQEWNLKNCVGNLLETIKQKWSIINRIKTSDIFKINDLEVRRICFTYLLPKDIMKEIDAKRRCVKGVNMKYFEFDENLNKVPFEKHNIYEIWEGKASKLENELSGKIYTVRCWCTTTNKEAWLWIDEKYKDDPLSAIASTFWVHENLLEHNPTFMRQGDLFFVETENKVIPEGKKRPLTKEEYFSMLICET